MTSNTTNSKKQKLSRNCILKIDWAEITANNIRNILKERSLTQTKLAEMLGKSVRTVRRWVRDGIDNVNSMCQICDVLNIGIERPFFAE